MRIRFPGPSVLRNLAVILLAGVWGNLSATPTPPPLLCVDDADCVESSAPDTGRTYTLADALVGVPFAVNTPTPPTITSEVTVTPATIGENKVNGRRIILTAGEYGNQSFNTQDQEIVFTPGAEFGFLSIGSSARRLTFRGSPARAGSIRYITTPWGGGPTDLLFDGIVQLHSTRDWEAGNYLHGQRIAFINSRLQARDYVIASFANNAAGYPTDIIIANCDMETLGSEIAAPNPIGDYTAAFRLNPVNRLVFVDNRLYKTSTSVYQNFRIHAGGGVNSDNIYACRNQFEGTGHSIGASGVGPGATVGRLINVWFEDNTMYKTNADVPINTGAPQHYAEVFRIRNNVLYGTNSWPTQLLPGWTVENNTVQAYQSPPAWEFR